MKKFSCSLIALFIGVSLISCGKFEKYSLKKEVWNGTTDLGVPSEMLAAPVMTGKPSMLAQEEPEGSPERPSNFKNSVRDRKIIYTAEINVEVKSCLDSIDKFKGMLTKINGYIADTNIQEHEKGRKTATLILKVPADNFDAVLAGFSSIGKVKSQVVHSNDITEDYVDMKARLDNAKRLEERLINLLEQKTTKLADMLAVEKELGRVREDIERFEGQKRYFDSQVSLSTITVYLSEPYKLTSSIFDPIKEAFESAGELLMTSVAWVIAFIAVAIPWIIIMGLLTWLVYFVVKKIRRKI